MRHPGDESASEAERIGGCARALGVLVSVYLGYPTSRADLDEALDEMFQFMEECNDAVPTAERPEGSDLGTRS